MIEYHKGLVESLKNKTGISNYGVAWISFIKGLLLGKLSFSFFRTYHFFII